MPICDDMDRLGGLPFVAQPWEKFVYGYATDILGCVIERASGCRWHSSSMPGSSARDYARLLQMLLNGGSLDGARILGPRTVRLLVSDHADSLYSGGAPGMGFGLGFEILEDPGLAGQYGGVGRFGWGGAYATNYWVDPSEGLVAVFMIQLLPSRGLDLGNKFRTLVYLAIVR